jgi:hypothetical protein
MHHRLLASSAGLLWALALLVPSASAQDVEAHPTLAAGFAFPVVGYEAYGIGVDLRLGLDVVFDQELSQLLSLELAWIGLAIPGARVDLVPLTVGHRWVPAPEIGFYTVVAGGVGLAIDTLEAQLGERRYEASQVRIAAFVSAGIGWTFAAHVDLEIVYRQAVAAGDAVDALGTIGARLGARL